MSAAASRVVTEPTDIVLLAVCFALQKQQARWQCLWEAAGRPDDAAAYEVDRSIPLSPERQALRDWTRKVWPATDDPFPQDGEVRTDLASRLVGMPAVTLAGIRAKAAAVMALQEAGSWSASRGDEYELVRSVLLDVVGDARTPVGAAA